MHLEVSPHDDHSLLTVTGDVGTVDVPVLRGQMLDVLESNPGDVLLDMRKVRSVSDHLMAALTATRARAKYLRHRIAVIDEATGTTTGSLRRLGMQFRIPVYCDPESAVAGLRADREARARFAGGRVEQSPTAVQKLSGSGGRP
jgi:anti-anti-sigma regulatory factor